MSPNELSSITVLGTGLMGSSLVEALLKAGHQVHIWNRTPEKCVHLTRLGANIYLSADAAVAASQVIFLVLTDYPITKSILKHVQLPGKTIVQVATGSLADAVELQEFCITRGASDYLDIKIMTYPDSVKEGSSLLLASGPEKTYRCLEPLLTAFGTSRFVDETISSATSTMLAWSVHFQVSLAGVLEAINAAIALRADPELVSEIATFLGTDVTGIAARWREAVRHSGSPRYAQSGTIVDQMAAADLILESTKQAGVHLPALNTVRYTLNRWIEAGFGHADIEDAFEAARRQEATLFRSEYKS